MKTRRPSDKTILCAFARFEPSLDRYPTTVTVSPFFSEYLVQPERINPFGLPSSNAQFTIFLPGSFPRRRCHHGVCDEASEQRWCQQGMSDPSGVGMERGDRREARGTFQYGYSQSDPGQTMCPGASPKRITR